MLKRTVCCFILGFATLTAVSSKSILPFERPSAVEESHWNNLQPYMMAADHPARKALDHIFKHSRATESAATLEKAGFKFKKHPKWDNVYIAKHRSLGGYILKFYTDDQIGIDETANMVRRIQGSNVIRDIIDRHQLNHQFKAPRKWLYPLPETPSTNNIAVQRKNFILVVEDMQILARDLNAKAWKSKILTKEVLDNLHLILQEGGLYDSIYIDNIPFSIDRKIAFIDTEHFHGGPVPYLVLLKGLPKKYHNYWTTICKD